jgi:hypothetical protein
VGNGDVIIPTGFVDTLAIVFQSVFARGRYVHRIRVAGWLLAACALLPSGGALADVFFQSVSGDVRTGGSPASAEQRVQAGTTVTTGADGRALLRFGDGQVLALYENTELRLAEYRFDLKRPEQDAMRLELARGALRWVTGLMGQRSRARVRLSTPQGAIEPEAADFMVAVTDASYVSVLSGAVDVSDAAGSVTFRSPAVASVAASGGKALELAAADVPAAAAKAFADLRGAAVGPGLEPDSGRPSTGPNYLGRTLAFLVGLAAFVLTTP